MKILFEPGVTGAVKPHPDRREPAGHRKRDQNEEVETRRETDVRLAEALIGGRLEEFDEFVEHFRTRVFQYSFLMCGHREDAEEVAQDTMLAVFENFRGLRDPRRVRAWVFRIRQERLPYEAAQKHLRPRSRTLAG